MQLHRDRERYRDLLFFEPEQIPHALELSGLADAIGLPFEARAWVRLALEMNPQDSQAARSPGSLRQTPLGAAGSPLGHAGLVAQGVARTANACRGSRGRADRRGGDHFPRRCRRLGPEIHLRRWPIKLALSAFWFGQPFTLRSFGSC